ncbi:conserved protein of unknown function [Candidatus Promineifilum breve]|uniref:DUF4012 domain-containing protein n=1 Tax=Candidatus Promineifilum breve TaxID=1806508 RepID=A0A160T0G5_9CHLR|nr:DUF4012 domain-containing protein [Candidatus Promineifilum breve]CUS02559.2 conserved protein of unknown function [Candidatus Promineifilum breve]
MTAKNRPIDPPSAPEAAREKAQPVTSPNTGRIARLLILAGLLILLVWLGLKTWRVIAAAQSLLAVEEEARALLSGGLNSLDPDAAEALVLGARADIVTLHRELDIARPVAPYLGWIPRFGPTLVAAPYLLDMADAGSEAGALAVSSLKPALAVIQHDDFSAARLGELLPILTAATPDIVAAQDALQRVSAARQALDDAVAVDQLPWRVRQLLQLADEYLPLAQDGLRLTPSLPALLGQDGPRRYLILAQNEDEMRATGGFITGAGVITVQNGQIIDLTFRDANQVDNWANKPYDFPPQPFYDFMGAELFLFRDANYWPDFPTSAQKAMELFVYGQDAPPLDGVIAIDQAFLRALVDATGPVPIPGTDRKINADNLLEMLRQARDIQEGQDVADWVNNRKAFLGGFATAIQAKLESDFGSIDPVKLARNMIGAIDNRHLSIYVRDPAVAAVLAANGWDGRLPEAPPGDFWMAVDTNMGFNKANVMVERSLQYVVSLGDRPQATLALNYRHTGPPSNEACFQGVEDEFEQAADYLTLADQCYWNFLRVYAPRGSRLLDSSTHLVPGDTLFNGVTWENAAQTYDEMPGLATFGNFMLLPRGAEGTVYFQYELPAGVVVSEDGDTVYRLTIHKQPGTRPEPLYLTVSLPSGAELLEASPTPTQVDGDIFIFELSLASDMELTMRYR